MVNISISMQRNTVTFLMNSFFFLNHLPPPPHFGAFIILLQNSSTVQDAEKDEELPDPETELSTPPNKSKWWYDVYVTYSNINTYH